MEEEVGSSSIDLSSKCLLEFPEALFSSNTEEVLQLEASNNKLTIIPNNIDVFENLTSLSIWNNEFKKVPESLGNLKKLKKLNLGYNEIEELPESFGGLEMLEDLKFGNNRLARLPESFWRLGNLKNLDLYFNQFDQFPDVILTLSSLVSLNLGENNLVELPSDIKIMTSLTELGLLSTGLSSIPNSLCHLTNLKVLDLRINSLQELPVEFKNLKSLAYLYLSYNNLDRIPEECLVSSLKNLHISGNLVEFKREQFSSTTLSVGVRAIAPDQIKSGLWLGSVEAAKHKHFLKKNKITHIVSVLNDYKPYYPKEFKYHQIFLEDSDDSDISNHFEDTIKFIEEGIDSGGVLVHCAAGVSRSATLVIAYIMHSQRISFKKAYALVQSKRNGILPNSGFLEQLQTFESNLEIIETTKTKQNCIIS